MASRTAREDSHGGGTSIIAAHCRDEATQCLLDLLAVASIDARRVYLLIDPSRAPTQGQIDADMLEIMHHVCLISTHQSIMRAYLSLSR